MPDIPRVLAGGLAVNRIVFGAGYLAEPRRAGSSWIGRAARRPGTQVIVRSQGVRDVALGLGALRALTRGGAAEARAWMAALALADGTDAVVTWAARRRLPAGQVRLALGVAAGSTVAALVGVVGVRERVRG